MSADEVTPYTEAERAAARAVAQRRLDACRNCYPLCADSAASGGGALLLWTVRGICALSVISAVLAVVCAVRAAKP